MFIFECLAGFSTLNCVVFAMFMVRVASSKNTDHGKNQKGNIFVIDEDGVTFWYHLLFCSTHKDHTQMCVYLWYKVVHHLACTAQPRGYTGRRQVLTFAGGGCWNIVQARMLHL